MTDRELWSAMYVARKAAADAAHLHEEWVRRLDWRRGKAKRGRFAKHKMRAVASFIARTYAYFDGREDEARSIGERLDKIEREHEDLLGTIMLATAEPAGDA